MMMQKTETQFSPETYEKKVFTFTRGELAKVRSYEAIKTMGLVADAVITTILNECMMKVGIQQEEGLGLFYDVGEGTYTMYIPRRIDEKIMQSEESVVDQGTEATTNA